jgi:hypothetical protein
MYNPLMGFEPIIPTFYGENQLHSLDRGANMTSLYVSSLLLAAAPKDFINFFYDFLTLSLKSNRRLTQIFFVFN